MYEFFTEEHKKYIDILGSNTDITTKSSTLSQNCSSAITSINSTFFSMVESSNWEELAKTTIINSILPGLNSSLQELSDFITNNLVTVCNLAIGSLLETCKQIRDKQKELDDTITSLNSKENNKPAKEEDIPGWEAECEELQNQRDTLVAVLTALCERVENIKKTIEALNSGLSAMEVNSLLSDLNSDGVTEIYPDLAVLLGIEGDFIVEDQIPIRFNKDTLYILLEGNAYRDMIMEYLEGYGTEGFNVADLYNKYAEIGLLPEWKSTEYDPNVLFNFAVFNKPSKFSYSDEAKEAITIVLNHTVYESMLPYYEAGTLDLYQDIRVRSIVYCSDFLVQFDYNNDEGTYNANAYSTDVSGFVNMSGGRCHYFANGVLIQAMNDFVGDYQVTESYDKKGNFVVTSPLVNQIYNSEGELIRTNRNEDGAFFDLFSTDKYPGASQYKSEGENTIRQDGVILGAPTAICNAPKNDSDNGSYHVIVPIYEAQVMNKKTGEYETMYIDAESSSVSSRLGMNLNLRTEKSVKNHNWTLTPNVLNGLNGLSETPDSFMHNYDEVN